MRKIIEIDNIFKTENQKKKYKESGCKLIGMGTYVNRTTGKLVFETKDGEVFEKTLVTFLRNPVPSQTKRRKERSSLSPVDRIFNSEHQKKVLAESGCEVLDCSKVEGRTSGKIVFRNSEGVVFERTLDAFLRRPHPSQVEVNKAVASGEKSITIDDIFNTEHRKKVYEESRCRLIDFSAYKNRTTGKLVFKDPYGDKFEKTLDMFIRRPESPKKWSINKINHYLKDKNKTWRCISTSYINSATNLEFKCLKCGYKKEACWNNMKREQTICIRCEWPLKFRENWSTLLEERKLRSLVDLETVPTTKDKFLTECLVCGLKQKKCIDNIRISGCVMCQSSSISKKVYDVLRELKLDFEVEKTYDDLKINQHLRYDYFVENSLLIEVQGRQHSQNEAGGFFTEERLKSLKERDELKKRYAIEKDIKLIYIEYYDTVETIRLKITEALNNK